MFCVIQKIETKKPNKYGHYKELVSEYMSMVIDGVDNGKYYYTYGEERFERPIKRAYKISIHESYRENGKPKKKQFVLCTVNYYDMADNYFNSYDYCDRKINEVSKKLKVDTQTIHDLVEAKTRPLIDKIQEEFSQTEEYKAKAEHEAITSLYAINKIKFGEKYPYHPDDYDKIYNVFGDLMNSKKLEDLKQWYEINKKYEEKFKSDGNSDYKSSYYNNLSSTYNDDDKKTLKQFYRVLSKKFHPDSNINSDTSQEMKLLNQLKSEWDI